MEIFFIALLVIGGIFSGLYASTVGGGSLVSFPLLLLTGLPIHSAIATNRLGVVILELSSTIKFYKEKKLNLKYGIIFGIIAALGSVLGSNIVISFEEKYLKLVIALLLLLVFLVSILKNKFGIKERELTGKNLIFSIFFTFLLGIYGGFFGAGFGTFIMFIFILAGFTFIKSAAISRIVGLLMSFVATIVFALNGLINYTYGLSLGFGFAIGGWIGVNIGIKKGNTYVKTLFIIIILATTLKLIVDFFK